MVEDVAADEQEVVFVLRAKAGGALCPGCGGLSARVHGRYRRSLSDTPLVGRRCRVFVTVRRFKCPQPSCDRATFVEQIPELTRPFARYTPPMTAALTAIALSCAGRAGARLAAALGMTAGRDTLIRLIRAQADPAVPAVIEVLGVDDFATRKGHRYGTILVDMATHRPIDVLADREAETFAAWLAEHPGIRVICRDRAGGYAEGARAGAPEAIQVADRFHLWQNLCQACEKVVITQRSQLAEPEPQATEPVTGQPAFTQAPPVLAAPPEKTIVTRIRRDYAEIQRLLAEGHSRNAVSRITGLYIATVRKYADAGCVEDLLAKTLQRASKIDAFKEHLHRRWNEGEHNATTLTWEITELGYTGSEQTVQRYLRRYRDGRPAPAPAPKPPTVRETSRWILTNPDHLGEDDTLALKKILERSPELARLDKHVRDFAKIMKGLRGQEIEQWIAAVEADTLPALTSFATNLRRDLDAVRNGLTLPHSSGAVEGNVNRIKMLKRQMFGRAKFDLLRKRTLLTH
ncbi:ISL3 family transposase [Kitasatospora sp. NPDC057542]|uniref:ISL3 family transposase n=1 Tax=Kitasatospora sp. NPDC057542 TaxID=3346162 RepID=UPI0036938576